jgi:TRF2-interacting telomeric protein/Rap1 - C terminal domain
VALEHTADLAGVQTEPYSSEQPMPMRSPLSATTPESPKKPSLPVLTDDHAPKGQSPPPTDNRSSVTSTASVKRKRGDMEEEPASTEGLVPPAAKRTRPQRKDDGGREIPSTPELGPSSPPVAFPSQTPPLPEPNEGEGSESENFPLLGQTISQSLTDRRPDSRWHEQTTQALLGGPTQVIDFELAEPEGGWDNLLDDETLQSRDYPLPQPSQPQDTQALLQGPTQILDFELAEPEGGWDGILPDHTLPQIIPKSASQQPSQNTIDTEKQLGAWIDAHVAAGTSEDDVLLALKCSSMHTGLAELVLNSLAKDEGVPEDVKGIWTEREDEALKGGDGRAIKMLEEKHGKEAFQMRWNFLATYDQIDDGL